jgi:type I restriction enzyme S subunit
LLYSIRATAASLEQKATGSTFSAVSGATVRGHLIPVAPLPEQRRIVDALEAHFTRLDAAVATLERVRANLKRYRATVLQATVQGRLGTAAGAAKWEPLRLADIADVKGGLAKGKKRRPHERVRAVPYLRVANVQRGYLDLAEMKEIEATEAEIEQLQLRDGDVLFNEGGDRDKLGRGWVWRDQIPECIHQNHVFRARLTRAGTDPRFISWYGNSAAQIYFQREGKQTTNLASINLNVLRNLRIPLPPPAEQRRIVDEIENALSICDAAERSVDSAQRRIHRLRKSLLRLAFDGRLVPQDPHDEPASVLLDRIRAKRAFTSSTPRMTRVRSPR